MSDAFWNWYAQGVNRGWCSELVCETHEGLPMTDEEMDEWHDGIDLCMVAVRVYGTERVDG